MRVAYVDDDTTTRLGIVTSMTFEGRLNKTLHLFTGNLPANVSF